MNRVILASASPRRRELLKNIFDVFDIIPAQIDERVPKNISAEKRPELIARKKAEFVAESHPQSLVIGCDTAVIAKGEMLGKPKDRQDALRMLKLLSGREHTVVTGCCLCFQGRARSFSAVTLVEFYSLEEREIEEYLSAPEQEGGDVKYQWQDKAGAYGIQGKAGLFVKGIKGDYNNVVGVPCARLKREISDFYEKTT